jgi:hypothetical protein
LPRPACAPSSLAQVQRLAEVVAESGLYGVKSAGEAMIRMMRQQTDGKLVATTEDVSFEMSLCA